MALLVCEANGRTEAGGEVGMSYESPITIMTKLIQDQTADRIENGIFKAVQYVGIFVDKEELVRALRYDRNEYEKGYHDRDAEIVRCKDCKRARLVEWGDHHKEYKCYPPATDDVPESFFRACRHPMA